MDTQNETSEPVRDNVMAPQATPRAARGRGRLFVSILVIVLIAAAAGVYAWQHQKVTTLNGKVSSLEAQVSNLNKQVARLQNPATPANPGTDNPAPGTFKGTITADGCATSTLPVGDVGCSITVNSSTIIDVKQGNVAPGQPWGSLINFPDLPANSTGKSVEVYAHQIDATHYSLEGSASYYVKITN